jgi:hypothetical protein
VDIELKQGSKKTTVEDIRPGEVFRVEAGDCRYGDFYIKTRGISSNSIKILMKDFPKEWEDSVLCVSVRDGFVSPFKKNLKVSRLRCKVVEMEDTEGNRICSKEANDESRNRTETGEI